MGRMAQESGMESLVAETPPARQTAAAGEGLPALSSEKRRRLTNFLFFKAFVELLFVAGLAVGLHYLSFNPHFRGWSEMHGAEVSGWAINEAAPQSRVEVQLYVDGRFVADALADKSRPDVVAAGRARDEWNGFRFELPALSEGEHEARVYVVQESGGGTLRTLRQLGKPLRFRVWEVEPGRLNVVSHGGEEKR